MADPYQTYLANITIQTGKTPAEIAAMLDDAEVLHKGVKTGVVVAWLKVQLGLGHGYAMAMVKWLKDHGKM